MNYKDTPNYGSSRYSSSFEDIPVCFNPLPDNSPIIKTSVVEPTPIAGGGWCSSGGNTIVSISMLDICCAPCVGCCNIFLYN